MHSYHIPVYFLSLHCWNPPIQTSPYRITSLIDSCQRKPCVVCPAPTTPSSTQLSCSNDRRVQHSRDPASRLSFAASDLLPRRRQPRQLHYHHQLSRWPWELHGSAREVAPFRVCLRYASLNMMTCTLSSCSPIRLQVRSKLMLKLEFLNGCGVRIGEAISTICLLSGSSGVYYVVHVGWATNNRWSIVYLFKLKL